MPNPPKPPKNAATWGGAVALGLWCWSGVCYRAGAEAVGALPFLSLACAVGVATSALIHCLRGKPLSQIARPPRRVMVAGFFGVTLYTLALSIAVARADARDVAQVMLVNYLWPIFMVLLGMRLLRQRVRMGRMLAAVAIGFSGIAVARGFDSLWRLPASLAPHALAAAGAFLWALYCVLLRRWNVPEDQGGSTFHFAVCGALAGAVAAGQGDWAAAMAGFNASALAWMAFMGVGPIGVAYYLWEIGVKRGAPHLLAILAFFTPVGSAVLIGVFFRETLNPGLLPGAALIAVAAGLGRKASGPTDSSDRQNWGSRALRQPSNQD